MILRTGVQEKYILYSMRYYGVYHLWWYVRQYEYCTNHNTIEFRFWTERINKNQDGMLENVLPVKPLKVHNLLHKNQKNQNK